MTTPSSLLPDTTLLQEIEANAAQFAREAGAILLRHFRTKVAVEYKGRGRHDPVTAADKESETFLRDAIHAAYPEHGVLGEEGNDIEAENSEFLWVLDPLDGTVNFLNGLPFFSVSVGVLHRGRPVAAAIFVPTSGLLHEGVFSANLLGRTTLDGGAPLQVSDNPLPEPSQLTSLPAHYWRRIRFSGDVQKSPGEVRALGSIALELALTASGTLQYAIFDFPRIWDIAAGVLLVRQAGGLVLLQAGRGKPWLPLERFEPLPKETGPLEGYRKWRGTIIVGNPEIAWAIATSFHRPARLPEPVRAAMRKAGQLAFWNHKPGR